MQDALPLCGIVIVLFCATALMEFDDRALNGTIGSVVEIGFWMFMLCMTVFTQIVVLILLMPVTTERLLTAIVQNLFAIVIPTSVLAFPLVSALMSGPNLFFVLIALIFEAISIIIWHMFIRSYYDVRPFKAGFFFTQTGFQSLLSAGNHRRRVQEVCHKESWKTESGLLYEQRLLYPYQFNVIDSFRWEGRGVHFLDATIGRPPWQNPEWHFQQAAHLERMSDKRDEENLKHKYAQPRRTKEFVNLCRSVMQLPIHLDDIEAETPNDAHTIARHVEEYLKKYSPRKNDYILCFSHNGISSMLVTLRLLQLGYKHTYDLGECAIRYPLINVKAQELTMLSMLAQEEAPGEILVPGYPSIRTH